jgi:pyruvate carboxylase subunit B
MGGAANKDDEGITVQDYFVEVGKREYKIRIGDAGTNVAIDGFAGTVEIRQIGEHLFSLLIDGKSIKVVAAASGPHLHFLVNGKSCTARIANARERVFNMLSTHHTQHRAVVEIRAPMPAMVVRVEVKAGDSVKVGQGLVILEAMKMENEIRSHHDGKVKEISVASKQIVEKGQLLLVME